MENDLRAWRINEWLTIHQASCLSCGIDPSKITASQQGRWQGIYAALETSIEHDLQEEYGNRTEIEALIPFSCDRAIEIADSYIESNKLLIFNSSTVKGYALMNNEALGSSDIAQAKIKVTAIKEWLENKGFKPSFFFLDEPIKQVLPTWKDLFIKHPRRHSEIFEAFKYAATSFIERRGSIPSRDQLWGELNDLFEYDEHKKAIIGISGIPMDRDNFRNNYARYVRKD